MSTGLRNFQIVTLWLRENDLACASGRINSIVIIIIMMSSFPTLILSPSSFQKKKKAAG